MTRNAPTRPGIRPRVAWRRNCPESTRPDFSLQLRTSDRSMSMLPPACRQAPIFNRDAWLDRKSTGKGVREHAASATNRTMRASNGLAADALDRTGLGSLGIRWPPSRSHTFSETRHTRCASINGAVAEQTIPKVIPAGSPFDLLAWTTKGGCGPRSRLNKPLRSPHGNKRRIWSASSHSKT